MESLASEIGLGVWDIEVAAKTDDAPVTLAVNVNAWRRASPDDFVPGPMNAVLGALGLADARTIRIVVQDGELGAKWERRKDDGAQQRVVVAKLEPTSSAKDPERWVLQGVGLDWCIRAASRITIELDDDESSATSWQRYDLYIRARSTLVRSLARATERISLCVTEDLEYAIVVEFERVIKPGSLRRAVDRLVAKNGIWDSQEEWVSRELPRITVRGAEFVPAVRVGRVGEKAVVVVAMSEADAQAVADSLSEISTE
ncbi:MAG: hypothetical protein COB69_00015 [Phycisphaera sp.]|nr:MAG: hypothetical protein COB69_00015 [Phycisphaera sp.]